MQVGRRLRQIRVAEHLLHVMNRPTRLQPAAAGLVPEIMEMEIDGSESRSGFRRERAVDSGGRVAVRLQNGGLASRHDLPWAIR